MKDNNTNPIDWYNINTDWRDIFGLFANISVKKKHIEYNGDNVGDIGETYFETSGTLILPKGKHNITFDKNEQYSKFMCYTMIKHNGVFSAAMNEIQMETFNKNAPYMRVGVDYYKLIFKTDRYGIRRTEIKGWKKDEMKQDYGPKILNTIPKFDDFVVWPDNDNYQACINNCYNAYSEFEHPFYDGDVSDVMYPMSMQLMRHIFGKQLDQGMSYLKILYQHPQRPFYILSLVSKKRNTGKTTFINWLDLIFGNNFMQTTIKDLENGFNGNYSAKNIIAIDEAVSDKKQVVELVKYLTTTKKLSVNEKWVRQYNVDFFGKMMFLSNQETKFMKVDSEEERFWIRKIPPITDDMRNENILEDLLKEIPFFLKHLRDLPDIDFSKHRFGILPCDIFNDSLVAVKEESKNWLYKEIKEYLIEYFFSGVDDIVYASAIDIKNKFFAYNNQVQNSFVKATLQDDFNLTPNKENKKYLSIVGEQKRGYFYTFKKSDFITGEIAEDVEENIVQEEKQETIDFKNPPQGTPF